MKEHVGDTASGVATAEVSTHSIDNGSPLTILISDWHRRSRQSQRVHYNCVNYYSRMDYYFGIPTIILSTVVGTTIFSTLQVDSPLWVKICTGLVSISAAVLSSLQTFLGYSNLVEEHKKHSAKYGAIRRDLEFMMAATFDENELKCRLESVGREMNVLAESSPRVPDSMKEKAVADLSAQPRKNLLFSCYDTNKQKKIGE